MKAICCMLLAVILFSCKEKQVPKDILPPKKMEMLMWEQMRADAFAKEFISKDTSRDAQKENLILQEKIFQKCNVNKEMFYKSYYYYLAHENLMKAVLDSVIAKQTRRKESDKLKRLLQIKPLNEQDK